MNKSRNGTTIKHKVKVTAVWWVDFDVDDDATDYDYENELSEASIDRIINSESIFDDAKWSVDVSEGIR